MEEQKNNLKHVRNISFFLMLFMFIGVFDLPYGYYTFLRIVTLIGTGLIIFMLYNAGEFENPFLWGTILILILWNPIAPIYMEKSVWIFFDIAAVIYFGFLAKKVSAL